MPCDYEGCTVLTGGVVTIIIDSQTRQFCSLSCAMNFLEDLFERWVQNRQQAGLN